MSSFKEVNEIRKSGKLEEAFEMAKTNLEKEPNNIWNKRAMAWVIHDYLKNSASVEKSSSFITWLNAMKMLELPTDEKMVFDSSAFQIGKLVFAVNNSKNIDFRMLDRIFEIIKDFHFTKPSEGYSFLYKAFHKSYENWDSYLDFAELWGFDNFRPEDYIGDELEGRKIMSIVEQAYIAFSKKLLNQFKPEYVKRIIATI